MRRTLYRFEAEVMPEAQATTEAQTQEVQGTATQTPKKVSILGDSYSTFQGHIPEN
ncbi:MAG: hypothetical protein IJN30_04335 [Bacteroidales bacterium]|nr:hypothetical protein [Bacteroidales bacterium]